MDPVEEENSTGNYKIAHISDLHVGSPHFEPMMLEAVILEINEFHPDIVVVCGDITNDGFKQEYGHAKQYLERIECGNKIITPGNHDSRNVGYVHFEDLFGPRNSVMYLPGLTIVALDSSEPDLDEGRLGRQNYRWIIEKLSRAGDFKIVTLHHHLIPIPGTGRERNIIEDAGDFLELLADHGIDLVLCGHKHVPHEWQFEGFCIVNAGTVSSRKVRGYATQCYNFIELTPDSCTVRRKYPAGEEVEVVSFPVHEKT
ncbi:MAG: metallophosphoesterase [Actinobacteria bacterium]|nr:metallophosphoesterase [Actinomycetota bacterium]